MSGLMKFVFFIALIGLCLFGVVKGIELIELSGVPASANAGETSWASGHILRIAVVAFLFIFLASLAFAPRRARAFGQLLNRQPFKGFTLAVLLTAVYGAILYFSYTFGASLLTEELRVSPRWSLGFVTALLGTIVGAVLVLYKPTGLPGDPRAVRGVLAGILIPTLIIFAWWFHDQPTRYVNTRTGEILIWIDDAKPNKPHWRAGVSDTTLLPYRKGTIEDVERLKKNVRPWTQAVTDTVRGSWSWLLKTADGLRRHGHEAHAPDRRRRTPSVPTTRARLSPEQRSILVAPEYSYRDRTRYCAQPVRYR